MSKEMDSIKEYLKDNLTRPAESVIIESLIEKMLKSNIRFVSSTPEVFYCPSCEKWITEDQIKTVEISRQTMVDPAEDADFCECGGSGEDFESMELSASELVEILNDKEFRL